MYGGIFGRTILSLTGWGIGRRGKKIYLSIIRICVVNGTQKDFK